MPPWYLAKTALHREKEAKLKVLALGFPAFLPMLRMKRMVRRKLVEILVPAASKCLFVQADMSPELWHKVCDTQEYDPQYKLIERFFPSWPPAPVPDVGEWMELADDEGAVPGPVVEEIARFTRGTRVNIVGEFDDSIYDRHDWFIDRDNGAGYHLRKTTVHGARMSVYCAYERVSLSLNEASFEGSERPSRRFCKGYLRKR